jgi:hypothetical protein
MRGVRASRLAIVATVVWALGAVAGCATSGVAPAIPFSIALADGRTCHDAGVVDVSLFRGATDYGDFLCQDAEAPMSVTADKLPLSEAVTVLGGAMQGAPLYRGSFVPADLVGRDADAPAVIVLAPDLAE